MRPENLYDHYRSVLRRIVPGRLPEVRNNKKRMIFHPLFVVFRYIGAAARLFGTERNQTTFAPVERFDTFGHVRRTDDHAGQFPFGKGVHIFDEDLLAGQNIQHRRERARRVGAVDSHHVGEPVTANLASRSTRLAASTSETIIRRIPKSAVSAMLNAYMLMPCSPRMRATSLMRPSCFPEIPIIV